MLVVHRAERADALATALAEVLREPLPDPMQPEVVAVPTRGVERWLAQTLSSTTGASTGRADGVCANVSFPFPGRLVGEALAAAVGVEREADPWAPERAVWPLLCVVEAAAGEPAFAFLRASVAAGEDAGAERRLGIVRHVADLFDRYAVHRPELLEAWAAGADGGWQAELWRRLRDAIGVPGPAERLAGGCARLRAEPELAALPARASVFGLTRLPASYLAVLGALAEHRDIHLFLLHPSLALWDRVTGAVDGHIPRRRADDATARLARNPILASWGRDAREMQLILAGSGAPVALPPGRGAPAGRETLLARIQADIRADAPPPGSPLRGEPDLRPLLEAGDRSIQVHACHGRARQVEVLRDAVLNLLADDPTLEPRDVIVMCPDIESFAPLVHAAFGVGGGDDGSGGEGDLRVRLADRSLRQTNPVLGVVAELLELARGRMTASQVLDLAGRPAVRRRFRFDDDDLDTLARWASAAGVRWGLDAADRAPYKLERVGANTWRAGWDRVLLGVAMADEEQRVVGGVVPLDDVSSSDIDLAGRFAELLERLATAIRGFRRPMTIAKWTEAVAAAADALTDTREDERWQREQLARLLDEVLDEATVAGAPNEADLTLPELSGLLADRLRGRPTRASFRTGSLTACTLVPMRSVPHRVVCLVGLDDGAFPRARGHDGDDLLLADPHVGDRDPRSEDRQLLLDALLAATQTLVVTYSGRDERTNLERPPAVPVGELLDAVDRTVRLPPVDGSPAAPARSRVLLEHPLQPFDARNFTPGKLVAGAPWSHDRIALAGARAAAGERAPTPPFLADRLAPVRADVVDLDDLVRFAQHATRAFLRQRLGVWVGELEDETRDGLPVEPDGLARWAIATRILDARLAGASADACRASEVARGELPPGALGRELLDALMRDVEALVEAASEAGLRWSEGSARDVRLRLPDGRLLVGAVPRVDGATAMEVTFSRLGPSRRLEAWVHLLAMAASEGRERAAVTIGRGRWRGVRTSVLRIGGDDARDLMDALVDLHDRGLREPLPIPCRTSAAYAEAAAAGQDAVRAAGREWTSSYERAREDRDAAHRLVLGGVVSVDRLLAAAPRADEDGPGWAADEPGRVGRLARRLWDPLLAHEEVTEG